MSGRSLIVAIVALTLACHGSSLTVAAPGRAAANTWAWLADTYWIVPDPYLPAVLFNPSTEELAPVTDQTVYHITGYRDGYFWGKNVTQLGANGVSCSSLVGSVTPRGRLLLDFTIAAGDGSFTLQQGFGGMVKKQRGWTMLNQTGTASFAHWAYMVQSAPGDASWTSLPGVDLSVEAFLAQCPGDGPQPVGGQRERADRASPPSGRDGRR